MGEHLVGLLPVAGPRDGRVVADLHGRGPQHVVETAARVPFANHRIGRQQQRAAAHARSPKPVPASPPTTARRGAAAAGRRPWPGPRSERSFDVANLPPRLSTNSRQHAVEAVVLGVVLRLEPIEISLVVGDDRFALQVRACSIPAPTRSAAATASNGGTEAEQACRPPAPSRGSLPSPPSSSASPTPWGRARRPAATAPGETSRRQSHCRSPRPTAARSRESASAGRCSMSRCRHG